VTARLGDVTRTRLAILRGTHLAVLWAVAVAQPIFDLVGRNAEFFVARGNRPVDIVLLTVGLTVVPPLALWSVELAVGAVAPALEEALHRLFVGALVALLALYVMKRLGVEPSTGVMVAMAVLVGAAAVFAYVRFRAPSAFLTIMAPAPLLFAGIFLLGSPVTKLVFPDAQASVAGASGHTRTPVVVLLLDELPLSSMLDDRGRIDPVRYPNFAALARNATWYRNAAGVSDATQFAVPGVLTGVRPDKDDLPIASDHPNNIFTLFGQSHLPIVTEPVTQLCTNCSARESEPASDRLRSLASDISVAYLHLVAPDAVRRSLPPVDRGWKDFRRRDAPAQASPDAPAQLSQGIYSARVRGFSQALDRLSREAHASRPPLAMLHVMLPHEPWEYLPSGEIYPSYGGTPGLFDDRWAKDPWFVEQAAQRHLLQVGFADRLLGRLVARLRSSGVYDEAALAVVADHGAGFDPGGRRRAVTRANFAELAAVPMLIKAPRQRQGRTEDRPVQTIDLVPTLADLLGITLPWHADGRPLRDGARGRTRIALMDRAGETVSMGARAFERQRGVFVDRMNNLFGSRSWESVYRMGPYADLVGRPTPQPAAGPGYGVEFSGLEALLSPHDRALLPAFATGRIAAGRRARVLALALDDRVVATTNVVREAGEDRFSIVISPRFLRRPATTVSLFAVRARGGERVLEPVADLAGSRYVFRRIGGRGFVVHQGTRIPIVPGALDGHVDTVWSEPELVRIAGWTANTRRLRPAQRVVVVSGGRTVSSGVVSTRRDDLADFFGAPLRFAGYEVSVPRRDLLGCRATIIGVQGRTATKLAWNPAALQQLRRFACRPPRSAR
jgi:hypothetical protein